MPLCLSLITMSQSTHPDDGPTGASKSGETLSQAISIRSSPPPRVVQPGKTLSQAISVIGSDEEDGTSIKRAFTVKDSPQTKLVPSKSKSVKAKSPTTSSSVSEEESDVEIVSSTFICSLHYYAPLTSRSRYPGPS